MSIFHITAQWFDGCYSSNFLRSSARRFLLEILVRGTKYEVYSARRTSPLTMVNSVVPVPHFLGQCPAIAQIREGNISRTIMYYLSVNDIFDNQHITTIVNFANRMTKRLSVPEELDQTGVT